MNALQVHLREQQKTVCPWTWGSERDGEIARALTHVNVTSPCRTPSGGSEGNSTVWLVGAGLITVAGLAGFTLGKPSIPKEDRAQPAAKVRLTQAVSCVSLPHVSPLIGIWPFGKTGYWK